MTTTDTTTTDTTTSDTTTEPADPFSLDGYWAIPRLSGLALGPDGSRLVAGIAEPDSKGVRLVSAVWELDPTGAAPARRLTRSGPGEANPAFLPDGSLLFTSARPDPEQPEDDTERPRLWLLPAGGGEARCIAAPQAGVSSLTVAREANVVVLAAPVLPDADDWEADSTRWKAREEAKVTAQLIDHYPMRFWDRWIGPRQTRLWAGVVGPDGTVEAWHDLLPEAGWQLEEQTFQVSADGRTVVASLMEPTSDPRDTTEHIVVIDLDDAAAPVGSRMLTSGDRTGYAAPALSPDGSRVAAVSETHGTPDGPLDRVLVVMDLAGGEPRRLAADLDRWPSSVPVWMDDERVAMVVDDDGRARIVEVEVASGSNRVLTPGEGAHASVVTVPGSGTLYAVRGDVGEIHRPVRIDVEAATSAPIPFPGDDVVPPGTVTRVETTADDGQRVPGWLVLPPDADGPAPLAVFIHGGPLASWNGWHWRWNPHLLAREGWAVLLPDPALSTGYGLEYVARGWGRWGAEPYTDIMSLVEATADRDDIDGDRVAALGGSFGGYMANWIAGHTDRFDAIVTHASLWDLEAFHGSTDLGPWWENEFGDAYLDPSRYREWSPHHHVDAISTPMLVIHGERDYRVPVGEGLALWTDLRRHGKVGQYLHFPDENHWILKPPNSRAWYETVIAFLDHHVRGAELRRPTHL